MFDMKGNVVAEGRYLDGKREGLWTGYFMSGETKLLTEMPYKDYPGPFISQAEFLGGKLHGTWVIYDQKHRKISQWDYADGLRHGKWTSWYANGRKMREVNYVNGDLDGDVLEWSPAGVLITQDVYQKGRKLARKVEYHTENRKKSDGLYLFAKRELQKEDEWWDAKLAQFTEVGKDERHGDWTGWHANGQMQVQGRYEHDAPVGEFTWWFPNGQVAIRGSFAHGQKDGSWTWYHPTGQKSTYGEFAVGAPDGVWIWWKEDGKVAQKVKYSTGAADKATGIADGSQPKASLSVEGKTTPEKDETTLSGEEKADLVPQAASTPEPEARR